MIEHISLPVSDLDRSVGFYDEVLAPLNYRRLRRSDTAAAYGAAADLAPSLWLLVATVDSASPGYGLHVSFRAPSRTAVDNFFHTAIAQGAKNAGEPGHRPQYTANFYGAFVLDPDGFKIEATYRSWP